MLNFILFGAGRIGKMHARNIAENSRTRLAYVVDPFAPEAAEELAAAHGAQATADPAVALRDRGVDAVLIASSTNTHVDLILQSARAGKAVLCEKPVDLDIARVDSCIRELQSYPVPVAIGFNRRFDPTHQALRKGIDDGEVGDVHQVIITSRDPAPPWLDYVKVSGGQFRDMTIHDFDMGRWLLGEEPVEVIAMASCLIDPEIGALGDSDSLMVIMRTASGKLCHINNSRKAVYGYDQRLEVFGSAGMLRTENWRETHLRRTNGQMTEAQDVLLNFFIERYARSYVNELNEFVDAVAAGRQPMISVEDGRRALLLADAALESSKTGKTVVVQ